MALSAERREELVPLSVRYYQLVSLGHPLSAIESQYDRSHLTEEEKIWVFATGRARYLGYSRLIKKQNRNNAKSSLLLGSGVVSIVFLVISMIGWPAHGRSPGLFLSAILFGIGAFLYGVWEWFHADMPNLRRDVQQYDDT